MTGFTPETEACLACHPSQKEVEPMTPVDEAVERVSEEDWNSLENRLLVRGHVCHLRQHPPGARPEEYELRSHREDEALFKEAAAAIKDLRALLSALELGSVASLPVVTANEPATPLSAEKMAYVVQLTLGEAQASGKPLAEQVDLVVAALSAPTTDGGPVVRADLALAACRIAAKETDLIAAQAFAQTAVDFLTGDYDPVAIGLEPAPPTGEGGGL